MSEIAGRCWACRELVTRAEWDARTHPCTPLTIDTSWHALVNPDNAPWRPGYRFCVSQDSKTLNTRRRIAKRVYRVHFEIDQDGLLQHTGGPRPTEHTQAAVEDLYARERPGSNYAAMRASA